MEIMNTLGVITSHLMSRFPKTSAAFFSRTGEALTRAAPATSRRKGENFIFKN